MPPLYGINIREYAWAGLAIHFFLLYVWRIGIESLILPQLG